MPDQHVPYADMNCRGVTLGLERSPAGHGKQLFNEYYICLLFSLLNVKGENANLFRKILVSNIERF